MIREMTEENTTLSVYMGTLVLCIFLVSRSGRLPATMVATFLGPMLAATVLVVKPLNPYQNLFAKKQGISLRNVKDNKSALLLLEILKSSAAKRYMTIIATGLSVLSTILGCCFWALQSKKFLTFDLSRDPVGLILTAPLSLGIESTFLLRWAMREMSAVQGGQSP